MQAETTLAPNGTDPLAQARALIQAEAQARVDRVLAALKDNNCEVKAALVIEDKQLFIDNVCGIPVATYVVAK